MSKLFAKTLIAAGVALSTIGLVHAADQQRDPNREQPRPVGQYLDDSAITAKVKAKHAEDKMVSAMRVNVETREGVVILSGEGRTENEIKRAETLAKQVDGVKSVSNMIELKPKS